MQKDPIKDLYTKFIAHKKLSKIKAKKRELINCILDYKKIYFIPSGFNTKDPKRYAITALELQIIPMIDLYNQLILFQKDHARRLGMYEEVQRIHLINTI